MKILFFIQQVFNLVGFLLLISHVNVISGQIVKTSNVVSIDAKEGDTIRLPCKINLSKNDINDENLAIFWMRKNNTNAENIAFRNTILEQEFGLEMDLPEGKYDLIIKSASYYRDNRKFECIVKKSGSKEKETTIAYQLTILIAPGSPIIRPEMPIAREDEPFELTCYSTGGSPSPEIEWFRNGIPIPGEITPGLNKDMPTKSVLKIIPTMADDRLPYSCKVYNRATTKENATEAQVSLTVHYTPRVAVGPYNPLNVLKGDNAYMTCSVVANPPPKRIYWLRNNKTIGSSINHSILNIDPSDTGLYTCIAENGILDKQGQNGVGELQLNVLYAPIVTLPNEIIEPKSDEQVNITCEVNSNPKPHTVSWYKLVHNVKKLVQEGAQMVIRKVRPEDSGIYVCIAQNTLKASEISISQTHSANSTVEIKVKHAPELVVITPEKPVAISGRSFNLTCRSQPEAHPKPTYKWWKEGDDNIISNSAELLFKIVHIRQEGKYYCSAENELGTSEVSSVNLVINEPPSLTFKMKPEIIKKQGEHGFSLTCRARGKPTPKVFWYHNNQLITNEPQYNVNNYASYDAQPVSMYKVETNENSDSSNTVESILHFESSSRKNNDELVAHDHGRYYCMFDNGLTDQPVKSGTFVKVEHAPILKHEHNRVAFDSGEYAALQCKMSAYPKPSFEWYFENHLIDRSYGSQPKYNFSLVEIGDDIWMSTLFIANVKKTDYGDYTCRSWNTLSDDEKTIIKLVEKSAPETPSHISIVEIQSDYVILSWQSGFNGGYHNTEYILSYSNEDSMFSKWRNETCRTLNPCKLTNLLSRKNYQFKVMATNPKGHSSFSEPVEGKTKVSFKDIPIPYEAFYDNAYNMVTFKIDSNELDLIAKIEVKTTMNTDVDIVDGEEITEQEHWKLLITSEIKNENSHLLNLPIIESSTSPSPGSEKNLVAKGAQYNDMRVSICLKTNTTLCSLTQTIKMDYVSSYQRENRVYSIEQLILIILVGGSLALGSVIFIFVFCVKKREKINKKDYDSESESDNRVKANAISNNYFNTNDSKALVDSQDDSTKMMPPPVYSTTPNTPTSTIGGNNGLSQNLQLNGNNYGTTNYFLNGSDPSPNSSNETTHSDIWMMKNEIILPDNQQFVNQSHYGTHPQNLLVNNVGNNYQLNNYGSPLDYSYSYYPRNQPEEYRQLTEDNYNMNVKNSLYAPYYEENNYGTTMQLTNNQPPMPPPIPMDSNDYFNSQQPTYQQQLAFEDETSYNNSSNSNGNSRVIREIIV